MANIMDVVAPFHIFSKIGGFTVFTINPKTLKVRLTILDVGIYLLSISVSIWSYISFWEFFSERVSHGSEITNLTLPILVFYDLTVMFINFLSQIFLRFRIAGIFEKFIRVDEKLTELNVHFDYRSQRSSLIVYCIILYVILAAIIGIHFAIFYLNQLNGGLLSCALTVFHGSYNLMSFITYYNQYALLMYAVKMRFAKLNQCLK